MRSEEKCRERFLSWPLSKLQGEEGKPSMTHLIILVSPIHENYFPCCLSCLYFFLFNVFEHRFSKATMKNTFFSSLTLFLIFLNDRNWNEFKNRGNVFFRNFHNFLICFVGKKLKWWRVFTYINLTNVSLLMKAFQKISRNRRVRGSVKRVFQYFLMISAILVRWFGKFLSTWKVNFSRFPCWYFCEGWFHFHTKN